MLLYTSLVESIIILCHLELSTFLILLITWVKQIQIKSFFFFFLGWCSRYKSISLKENKKEMFTRLCNPYSNLNTPTINSFTTNYQFLLFCSCTKFLPFHHHQYLIVFTMVLNKKRSLSNPTESQHSNWSNLNTDLL